MNWSWTLAGAIPALLLGGIGHSREATPKSPPADAPHAEIRRDCEEAVQQKLRNGDSYKAEMVGIRPHPEGAKRAGGMRVSAAFTVRDDAGRLNSGMVECSYDRNETRTNMWLLISEP